MSETTEGTKTEWSNSRVLKLIEVYQKHECLWDKNSRYSRHSSVKEEAWYSIAKDMDCCVLEVKKKMESVLSSLRREKLKTVRGRNKPNGTSYRSNWYAYPSLYFLCDNMPIESRPEKKKRPSVTLHAEEDSDHTYRRRESLDEYKTPAKLIKTDPSPRLKVNPLISPSKPFQTLHRIVKSDQVASKRSSKDSIYIEYFASKLEKYSERCKNIVQHRINNILFDADMGKFDDHETQMVEDPDQVCTVQMIATYDSPPNLQPADGLELSTNNSDNEDPISPDIEYKAVSMGSM